MKSNYDCVWNVCASVRSTYTEDGAVLLDIEKGLCYSLNTVAARLWNSLEEFRSGVAFSSLIDAVSRQFDVPRQQLEVDVSEHLEKLEKMGLVRRGSAPMYQQST